MQLNKEGTQMISETSGPDPETLLEGYRRAEATRRPWEALWRDCAAVALPHGTNGAARIYDATAADAAEQLAASLLAELTPPFQRWVGFEPGNGAGAGTAELLEEAAATVQGHLDRSGFAVEMHQALLDLVVFGTGCLLFEESALGSASAFRFTAVPLREAVLQEGPEGRLDRVWRRRELGLSALRARFPRAPEVAGDGPFGVVECVAPEAGGGYRYRAVLEGGGGKAAHMLAEGRFAVSPFVCFRWLKAPGETYGRSPVMKALPDIKTADKVVELILKNASIAATGIWQADDARARARFGAAGTGSAGGSAAALLGGLAAESERESRHAGDAASRRLGALRADRAHAGRLERLALLRRSGGLLAPRGR